MPIRVFCTLISVIFFSLSANAIVDMRNANYSDTWVLLQTNNTGYDLKFQATYNSRTLFSGMLGFGFCSEFETNLKITAENTLRVTECGAGFEVEYKPGNYNTKDIESNIKKIMLEVRNRNKGKPETFFTNLERDLKLDSTLRDEFAKQLNMDMRVKENTRYIAEGRATDYIIFSNGEYTRNLGNGVTQKFNKNGRLIQVNDRNGNFIKIAYRGDKIMSVTDNTGASLQMKYYDNSKLLQSVRGPNNLLATLKFQGESLTEFTNAGKKTFKFSYDELYNMTKIIFPDKKTVTITYNKDKDWVTSYTDRQGCKETYTYQDGEKDPLNHYKSIVEKKCGNKITHKSTYEFWHVVRKDGRRVLTRTLANVNGRVTDTTYHEIFGKPTEIRDDGNLSKFDYYPTGQLMRKTVTGSVFNYSYDPKCNKVSKVELTTLIPTTTTDKNRKPSKVETRTITSNFLYDTKRCNLMTAKNSMGQSVQLNYDMRGRISRIVDQSKKEVAITYEDRFGKPLTVTRPGLGTIRFKYKADGSVQELNSEDDPIVASQVLAIFSNMLELIAPATTETNNI